MTQDEKVAILKEAGVWDVIGYPTCIDKLFDLVAAHEREACAKVCEELPKIRTTTDGGLGVRGIVGKHLAAAIRSRCSQGSRGEK